jgi:hypothetical protein
MPEEADWPDTIPVTPEVAREVVGELQRLLAEDWRLMPIGGTYLGLGGFGDIASTTKDVDLVATVDPGEGASIPDYEDVLAFAREHSEHVQGRKDHTCVKFVLDTEAGPAEIEIVRGRSTGQGGYFVSRGILEETLEIAEEKDGLLWPPVEALAFLKAWAAHDKQKLVDAGKDARGYHADRREQFLDDVRILLDELLDDGVRPGETVFERLFERTGGEREAAVREILIETGWLQR